MAEGDAKLVWDSAGERYYETGTDHGVLYPMKEDGSYDKGVAWNGLTAVTEQPGGAEETALYADDIKYAALRSAETFGATIEAYTYPDEFALCDGSTEPEPGVSIGQQSRKSFGFAYRTKLGNDQDTEAGYKLHLVYGATASPSEKAYTTINDSPEAITFSWEITTNPVNVTGHNPTALLTIDSRKVSPEGLAAIEEVLYGKDPTGPEANDGVAPKLPLPDEVISTISTASTSLMSNTVQESSTPTSMTDDELE